MNKKNELFTEQAALYAQSRPNYPQEMLDWITMQCADHRCLWDCGTGSGQVAYALAERFEKIWATDVNAAQLAHAAQHPRIHYQQSPAEHSGLAPQSVDLITVAQALHWFDHETFNQEVDRVLKPGGFLAVWCYGLVSTQHAKLNQIIHRFYNEITAAYWAPERQHIDDQYQNIPIPFARQTAPAFSMQKSLSIDALVSYFATWSAVNTHLKQTGESLIDTWLKPQLSPLHLTDTIECSWPITLIVTKKGHA